VAQLPGKISYPAVPAVAQAERRAPYGHLNTKPGIVGGTVGAINQFFSTGQLFLFMIFPLVAGVLGLLAKIPRIGAYFATGARWAAVPTEAVRNGTVGGIATQVANTKIGQHVASTPVAGKIGRYAQQTHVAEMNANDFLIKGAYYTSQAMTAYGTAKLFSDKLSTLCHIYEGITEQKISRAAMFRKMLFGGSLPKEMQALRRQYWVSTLPLLGTAVAGMTIVGLLNRKNVSGKLAIAGSIAQSVIIGPIEGAVSSSNNFLSVYQKLAHAQSQGATLDAGAYLSLLLYASPKASELGPNHMGLQQVARYYASHDYMGAKDMHVRADAKGMLVGHVMNQIASGAFDKLLAQAQNNALPVITAHQNGAKPAVTAKPPQDVTLGGRVFSSKNAQSGFAAALPVKQPAGSYADAVAAQKVIANSNTVADRTIAS
jgi:hypothetical protein